MNVSFFKLSTHTGTYKRFWQFLAKPDFNKTIFSVKEVVTAFFSLFFLKYLLSIFILVSMSFFCDVQNKSVDKIMEYPLLASAILIMFVGPLIEEVAFRLSLRFKPHYIAMTLSVISYYIITALTTENGNFDYEHHLPFRIFTSVIIGLLAYPMGKRYSKQIRHFTDKYFKQIVYLSSTSFGYVHLFNYEINTSTLLLSPLLLFPQLADGFIFAYIRTKYGFIYSLILHILNNSLMFILKVTIS